MKNKVYLGVVSMVLLIMLSACQGENDNHQQDQTTTPHSMDKDS